MFSKSKNPEHDALSVSSSSVKTAAMVHLQATKAPMGQQRNAARTDMLASSVGTSVSVAAIDENQLVENANPSKYEKRIDELESSIKSVDRSIKEYQPMADQGSLMQVLKHCEALASEIGAQKKKRHMLEDRAKQLGKLLQHERGEREAWLVAFLKSLHTTLQELTNCIDRSISDSSELMTNSMDGTDEIMSHLIDRVDQLLIQKESELAPVLEYDETSSPK